MINAILNFISMFEAESRVVSLNGVNFIIYNDDIPRTINLADIPDEWALEW